ncbi:hypothetical protein NGM99_11795 [Mesorhizobium sp. RP14(2022)]|uniref:Mandelate racemase/muconate lactonizing enzyme N-terminal domain-containing protein n=1 Tax=Mesorhizobium liriopis TaxID=2953882 RepID=A0ABT1C6K5_9HYPH|nr:hypothetical protein [Mesorhizobium liriopis]MCO6050464.1 hypothetical protein [Mesorhizobium liriopis]
MLPAYVEYRPFECWTFGLECDGTTVLNAKTALDLACWDVFGKSVGMPVCDLLGGRCGMLLRRPRDNCIHESYGGRSPYQIRPSPLPQFSLTVSIATLVEVLAT